MDDLIWFRKTFDGTLWRPVAWQGWAVTGIWILSNLWYFARVDRQSHSISDTLIGVGPFFIISTIMFLVIVRYRSGRNWE